MKLEKYEKNYLEKVVSVSGKDIATVRCILRSLLLMTSLEIWAGYDTVTIPFLGDLKVKLSSVKKNNKINTDIETDFVPSKLFKEQIIDVYHNEEPPTNKWLELNLELVIDDILDK